MLIFINLSVDESEACNASCVCAGMPIGASFTINVNLKLQEYKDAVVRLLIV